MKKALFIIPECFIETHLVSILLDDIKVNHQNGCGAVSNTMQNKFGDQFAIGFIDDDKRKSAYTKKFNTIATLTISDRASIIFQKHKERHHYLLIVSPEMEILLLESAELAGIEMKDFDLPNDLEGLKKITKNINTNDNPNLRKLIKHLSKSSLKPYKKALKYMIDNSYKIEERKLKELLIEGQNKKV